jgi:hypothetical protein
MRITSGGTSALGQRSRQLPGLPAPDEAGPAAGVGEVRPPYESDLGFRELVKRGKAHERAGLDQYRADWRRSPRHRKPMQRMLHGRASPSCRTGLRPAGTRTPGQADFNKELSGIRAAAERAVASVKTWRMLSEEGGRYRAPISKYAKMLAAVTGLYFFSNYYNPYE